MSTLNTSREYAAFELLFASDLNAIVDDFETFFNTDLADNENIDFEEITENTTTNQTTNVLSEVSSSGIDTLISTASGAGLSGLLTNQSIRSDNIKIATQEFNLTFSDSLSLNLDPGKWLIFLHSDLEMRVIGSGDGGTFGINAETIYEFSGITGVTTPQSSLNGLAVVDEDVNVTVTVSPPPTSTSNRNGVSSKQAGSALLYGEVATSATITTSLNKIFDETADDGFRFTGSYTITAVRLF